MTRRRPRRGNALAWHVRLSDCLLTPHHPTNKTQRGSVALRSKHDWFGMRMCVRCLYAFARIQNAVRNAYAAGARCCHTTAVVFVLLLCGIVNGDGMDDGGSGGGWRVNALRAATRVQCSADAVVVLGLVALAHSANINVRVCCFERAEPTEQRRTNDFSKWPPLSSLLQQNRFGSDWKKRLLNRFRARDIEINVKKPTVIVRTV